MKIYNIVFLGPPGGGKGTQADLVCQKLGVPHISTGDIFRELSKDEENPLSKELKSYMNSGQLVPDEIVVKIVMERLTKDDCKNGYLLDGFPRSLEQAKILDSSLKNAPLTNVILIDVDEEKLIKRLTGRRIAKNSGRIYNIYFNPPKVEGRCDESGEELIQRDDDKLETVKKRLQVYKDQTMPSVDYYQQKGVLKRINGDRPIEEVFADIMEVLGA